MSTLEGNKEEDSFHSNKNNNNNNSSSSRRLSLSSATSDLTLDSEDQAANIANYINEFTSDDVDIFASSNNDVNGGRRTTSYSVGTAPPFTSNVFNPNNKMMSQFTASSEQDSSYSQSISVGLDRYANTRDMTSDTTTGGGGGGDSNNSNSNNNNNRGDRGEYSEELRDSFNVGGGARVSHHGKQSSGNAYGGHRGNRYSASITGPILGRETYQYFHDTMANKNNTGPDAESGQGSFFQQLGESLVEGTKQLESGAAEIEGDNEVTNNTVESETEAEDVPDTVPEKENSSYFANVVSSAPAFKPQQGSPILPNQQYFFGFPPQIYGNMFPHPPMDGDQHQQQQQQPQQPQQHFPVMGPSNFLSHIIHPGLPPSAPMLHQGRLPVPFPVPIPVQMPTSQGTVLKEGNTPNKEVTGVPNIRPETPTAMTTPEMPGTFLPVPQPGAPMMFMGPNAYVASPSPQPLVPTPKDAPSEFPGSPPAVKSMGTEASTTGSDTTGKEDIRTQPFSSPKDHNTTASNYSKSKSSGSVSTRNPSELHKRRSSPLHQQHSRVRPHSHAHSYQQPRSSHRSALLEEIRNLTIRDEAREANGRRRQQQQQHPQQKKTTPDKEYSLRDISGHALEFCRDQYGSRFIQKQLAVASPEDKETLFNEIKDQTLALAGDVFGNYVIQKFFEFGSDEQRTWLVDQFEGKVKQLSTEMYACRVIQTALEYIDTERCVALVSELDGSVLNMIKDQNGNHVIQKAVERIPLSRIPFVLNSIKGHVYNLATHSYGCRVIQRLMEFGTAADQEVILSELSEFIPLLIEDQYGNYVIQYVLEHGSDKGAPSCMTDMKQQIINIVSKNVVEFSKHKFASNVVEKTVLYGTPDQKQMILSRILPRDEEHAAHLEDNAPLILMIRDQFANYVVQKLVPATEGEGKRLVVIAIKSYLDKLNKSGSSGNRHLASVEKLAALVQSVEL